MDCDVPPSCARLCLPALNLRQLPGFTNDLEPVRCEAAKAGIRREAKGRVVVRWLALLSFCGALCMGADTPSNTDPQQPQTANQAPVAVVAHGQPYELAKRAQEKENKSEVGGISADVWMAIFTAVLTIATILLWLETKRAINDSRKSSERQLRAYVGVDKISFEIRSRKEGYKPLIPGAGDNIYTDFICVEVKNFGQTPAREVSVYAWEISVDFFSRLETGFDFDSRMPVVRSNIVAHAYISKGQSAIITVPIIDSRFYWDAREKKKSTYIYGRIFYIDAYDRSWSTKFCYIWEPFHPGGERFVPYEEFNGEDEREEAPLLPMYAPDATD
jgi:hypothetical protein